MQLSEIEAFLAVIQTGSLSKAAEELYVTQPTLSHRIQTLEKELGTQLLIRNKGQRKSIPTDAGRSFVRIAEQWTKLWESSMKISSSSIQPSFRVAATQTLSNYVMPSVYAKFVQRDFAVTLELFTLHYQECYDAVEKRSMDAVFVSRTISSDRVSAIPVFSEKMVLLCNTSSPYSGPIHPSELPMDKGIYMHWNHNYAMWHEYWFGTTHYNISADNMRLVEKILTSTDRWAIVPISAAREVVKSKNLQYLPLLDPPPNREVFLLTLEPQHECTQFIVEDLISILHDER